MYKLLPEEIKQELGDIADREELEYADNFRAYRHKDDKFLEEYNDSVSYGCCGYYDVDFVDSHGDTWTIGCNYGH